MKTNREFHVEARRILRTDAWWGRILVGGAILTGLVYVGTYALTRAYAHYNIQTWNDFYRLMLRMQAMGTECVVPSVRAWWRLTGGSVFSELTGYLLNGIAGFGGAALCLKAVRGEKAGWFGATLAGLARPFEVLWLAARIAIQTALWMLLLIIPGIVAIFRYSQAWYLKADHPDWTAGRCLSESGRLMAGRKALLFSLICSYLLPVLPFALAFVLVGRFGTSWGVSPLVSLLLLLVTLVVAVVMGLRLSVASALFHEELVKTEPAAPSEEPPASPEPTAA